MSELYERIESLCTARSITVTDMCRESGAPRGSLTDLKKGRTDNLHPKTLSKISAYFDVSVDFLLGEDNKKEPSPCREELSDYDMKVLAWFRTLSAEKRQAILTIGDAPKDLSAGPDHE